MIVREDIVDGSKVSEEVVGRGMEGSLLFKRWLQAPSSTGTGRPAGKVVSSYRVSTYRYYHQYVNNSDE